MTSRTSVSDDVRAMVPPSLAALPSVFASAIDRATGRVNDWALDHLLDAAGGLSLALLPVSFLAWMFITR
ncbi:hypothetical protein [Lichenicoccus sp.]|uniref:hypothetical protein n=1 Tax=Lichenicoccus sp. TaxID=2781899 RepID=UPI003D0C70CA